MSRLNNGGPGLSTAVKKMRSDKLTTETLSPESGLFTSGNIDGMVTPQTFQSSSSNTHLSPNITPKRRASFESLPFRSSSSSSSSSSIMRLFPKQNTRHLQLPSFKELGIAAPSPNNASLNATPTTTTEPPRKNSCPTDTSSTLVRVSASAPNSDSASGMPLSVSYNKSPLPPTPPDDEAHHIMWNPSSNNNNSPTSDPRAVGDPEPMSSEEEITSQRPVASTGSNDSVQPSGSVAASGGNPSNIGPLDGDNFASGEDTESWLENGICLAVSSLPISRTRGEAVQLVSQTLPCPPSDSSPAALPQPAFSSIVQAIQRGLQPGQSPYVNITHAVPPRFTLSSLPTSPPSTPNLMYPGDDYFNLTVFSNATAVPGYPSPGASGKLPPGTPATPAPIVPPHSVHVAAIERYLPPTSPREYKDFFSSAGPSALVDRLLELSPRGGNLLLIYPTKQGAQTFKNEYLGPVLDPLLRQLVVINNLSADIGMALGSLPSVAQMGDFATMQAKIHALCHSLTKREATATRPSSPTSDTNTNSHDSSRFTLIYSGKGEIQVDRKSWTEWYIQQESPRIRDILNTYWKSGSRLPSNRMAAQTPRKSADLEITYSSLLREILDGIRNRSGNDRKSGPSTGLEMGVFVIRRSLDTAREKAN